MNLSFLFELMEILSIAMFALLYLIRLRKIDFYKSIHNFAQRIFFVQSTTMIFTNLFSSVYFK